MTVPSPQNCRLVSDISRFRIWQKDVGSALRGAAGPAVRCLREGPVWLDFMARGRGRGPCAVFLPAYGPHGAALLRIYNLASGLRHNGWRCVVLPSKLNLAQRNRLLAAIRPDIVVMQGARHALNRPELYSGAPVVYDLDDADFHLPHLAAPVAHAMRKVAGVIAGSRYIAEWCRAQGARADILWTASPVSRRPPVPQGLRPPVVAWAQTRPASYVAEAAFVREVMERVCRTRPEVRLRLYDRQPGDDPAFADSFVAAGVPTEWRGTASYRDYLASFDDVALGLAPLCGSDGFVRGKSFGKVLAYLDRRVPVIASDACEHGRFFDVSSGVVSNDRDLWVERICALLSDAGARQDMSDAAYLRFEARLSLPEAARRADVILRRYLGGNVT